MTLETIHLSLIPARFLPQPMPPFYYQQVIVNWLAVEVPQSKPNPIVDRLKGWRNREVYWYVRANDWTARMYA